MFSLNKRRHSLSLQCESGCAGIVALIRECPLSATCPVGAKPNAANQTRGFGRLHIACPFGKHAYTDNPASLLMPLGAASST